MKTAFAILFTGLLAGCASAPIEEPAVTEIPLLGDPGQQKTIFVFLDGTRNDDRSRTNVRQAYEAILRDQHRQTIGLYIEGVGSAETPVLGSVLGLGMQPRILRGYDFIAQHYQPGDRIIILGFSRGAHQARALAGLLSYAGVPVNIPPETPERRTIETRIIDIVKAKNDLDYQAQWKNWHPGRRRCWLPISKPR